MNSGKDENRGCGGSVMNSYVGAHREIFGGDFTPDYLTPKEGRLRLSGKRLRTMVTTGESLGHQRSRRFQKIRLKRQDDFDRRAHRCRDKVSRLAVDYELHFAIRVLRLIIIRFRNAKARDQRRMIRHGLQIARAAHLRQRILQLRDANEAGPLGRLQSRDRKPIEQVSGWLAIYALADM